MIRVYLENIEQLVKSDKKSQSYLYYLQIRESSKSRCGTFKIEDLCNTLKLSLKSSRKALKRLIDYGYVTVHNGYYRIVSQLRFETKRRKKFFKISAEYLNNYSWKNISSFRALLLEALVQINRNTKKYLRRGVAVIGRDGVREVIKNQSKAGFDNLVSLSYAQYLSGKAKSTLWKYRFKQKVATYTKGKLMKVEQEGVARENKNYFLTDSYKGFFGKYFVLGNILYFSPISERLNTLSIRCV